LFACDPLATCVQYPQPYASEADCADEERQLLEEVRDSAHAAGLTYDAACVEATIAGYAAKGCDAEERLRVSDPSALDLCPPYYGTIPEGENPCFEVVGSALSECGSGLVCSEPGGECEVYNDDCKCSEGSACNDQAARPDVCVAVLERGAACDVMQLEPTSTCAPDDFCEPTYDPEQMVWNGTCAPRKEVGAECSRAEECLSYKCLGVCAPAEPVLCWMAPRWWR
jgi:hypothetical protein